MTSFKQLPRFLFIGLFLFCTIGWSKDEAALQEIYVNANAKLESGDMAGAIEGYNQILKEKPRSDNVWLRRALAKWSLKDVSGALVDVAMAMELAADHPDAYRLRANIRLEQQEFDDALLDINQSLKLDPKFATSYVIRAKILHAQGGVAVPDLDRAIQLDPELLEAIVLRAQINNEAGNATWALADYDRAIALAPDLPAAYYDRAWVRFSQANWSGTIEDGKKHIELTKPNGLTLRVIGCAQFGEGDYGAAIKTLTQAADLTPDAGEALPDVLYLRQLALVRSVGADDRLARSLAGWKEGSWARALGRFLAGQLTEEELDEVAGPLEIDEETRGHHCEANFYIGVMRLKAGDRPAARLRFEACLAAAQPTFIEHTLAKEELKKFKKR